MSSIKSLREMSGNKFPNFVFILACIGAAISIYPNTAFANQSGTYLAGTGTTADRARIIELQNHKIVGNIEEYTLSNGKISVENYPISGAFNGKLIVLKIGTGNLLYPKISASGTLTHRSMAIEGGAGADALKIVLTRGDSREFHTLLDVLMQNKEKYLQQIAREQKRKDLAAILVNLTNKLNNDATEMAHLTKFTDEYHNSYKLHAEDLLKIEAYYQRITSKIENLSQKNVYSQGSSGVDYLKASVLDDERQDNQDAEFHHRSIRNHFQQVLKFDQKIGIQINKMLAICSSSTTPAAKKQLRHVSQEGIALSQKASSPTVSAERQRYLQQGANLARNFVSAEQSVGTTCKIFEARLPTLQHDIAADKAAYQTEDSIWQTENRRQLAIIEATVRAGY